LGTDEGGGGGGPLSAALEPTGGWRRGSQNGEVGLGLLGCGLALLARLGPALLLVLHADMADAR